MDGPERSQKARAVSKEQPRDRRERGSRERAVGAFALFHRRSEDAVGVFRSPSEISDF
jgi:hypothetical protein